MLPSSLKEPSGIGDLEDLGGGRSCFKVIFYIMFVFIQCPLQEMF